MRFFEDMQTFVTVGPISIKWYAILILTGAFLAYAISLYNFKKMGYSSDLGDNVFVGSLLSGVIGARLWFVAFYDLEYYLQNPLEILMTWEGGLAIQGGLLFGAGFAYFYLKHKNISFMRLADAVVPNILIAQALGRWGNFLNQEAFGRAVEPSFYDGWPRFIADHMYINGSYQEPTFLYESSLNILGWILIVLVYKRISKLKRGDLVYAYMMWYGVVRFFVEQFRSDSLMFFGLKSAQLLSIVFIVVGVMGTLGVFRKLITKKKPVLLFDFDGTLMDTEPVVQHGLKEVIKNHDPSIEITDAMANSFVGPPLTETFGRFFKEEMIQDLIDEYRALSNAMHATHVKPINHAVEILEELKAQGYTLGVVSSKIKETIYFGMDMFDMRKYFDVVLGLDDVKKHKPSPEGIFKACQMLGMSHDSVVYVGDTAIDVVTGANAGVYTIALMSNPTRNQELTKSNPNQLITDLKQLLIILEKEDVEWTRSTT
jgi:phosphatidylglycerol:prolipoprotein diacylglycerol transferase